MPIFQTLAGGLPASKRMILSSTIALGAMITASPSFAAIDLGPYGKVSGDVRMRYERVEEDARPRTGVANTVRAHLGYQTPEWNNFHAFGEIETVRHLGSADFDDGTNGKTTFGRVSDPEMNGINQLYIHYKPSADFSARLGRQPLQFDNQRFVAKPGSRQNDVTHDALLFKYSPIENVDLAYAHVARVHRYTGRRTTAGQYEGNINLFNAHYDAGHDIGISAYSYWLDFDGVTAERNLSSKTNGVRLTWEPEGDGLHPVAAIEFAHQSDYGHSARSYSENYLSADLGARYNKIELVFTYERLGGNGTAAMQTPIGSAHGFTGWTDRFTTIPPDGLRDLRFNLTVPYALPWEGQSLEFVGQAHWFTSDDGDIDYGREAGGMVTYKPVKNHSINLKYSKYNADKFSSDTNKLLLAYEYKF
jgi:hypothetical protein